MRAKINWEFVKEFAMSRNPKDSIEAKRIQELIAVVPGTGQPTRFNSTPQAEGEEDVSCCHGFDHWGKCSICNRAGMECTPVMPNIIPTFEEAWAVKKAEGYQYGEDALEQVRFGWELRESYITQS